MLLQASRLWHRIPFGVRRWILPLVLVCAVVVAASFIPVVSAHVPGMRAVSDAVRTVLGLRPAPAPRRAAALPFTVASFPDGATVLVDGRTAGKTPITLRLTPGTYRLTISRPGYAPVTRTVTVKKGAPASLTVRLSAAGSRPKTATAPAPKTAVRPAPKPAQAPSAVPAKSAATLPFTVRSSPAGASVQVNGKTVGKTPVTLRLAPGTHRLTISRTGYATVTRSVTVKKGGAASLSVTLSPAAARPSPSKPSPAAPAPQAGTAPRLLTVGARAPAISLRDSAGRTHSLAALRGRQVVVLFAWDLDARSRALIEELDGHARLAGVDHPALVVLGGGDPAAVRRYVTGKALRVPVLVGGEAAARSYGVPKGTLAVYVVSETGMIAQRQVNSILLAPLFPRPGRQGGPSVPSGWAEPAVVRAAHRA